MSYSQNEDDVSFKPLPQFSISNPKLTGHTEMLLLQTSVGSKGLGSVLLSCFLLEKKKLYSFLEVTAGPWEDQATFTLYVTAAFLLLTNHLPKPGKWNVVSAGELRW